MTDDLTTIAAVSPEGALELLAAGALLLDVREVEEWTAGHAVEAVHIAMGSVPERLAEIPVDRTVVCACRVGGRSGVVASSLAAAGLDARNLDGGMLAWESAGFPVVTDAGGPGRVV